ncbi:transposase [Tsukamurella sp. 8F]|uniref:RNA-guided endonuclease InsQ/TnpB family protein n=1 Tax=unclassified Tsukamurella TaxID=2633480 RepID=UPI0023B8EE59|nr:MULTISPECIES: transposase [unclassified Tsukamurella]MDF0531119.1 transposase [Tsukamurella sp. 8J]MDF0588365.1 transposase [Tsukamurella sp. 8F]
MSIRQRACPTVGSQLDVLTMHCSHARYVYNVGLEFRRLAYQHKLRFGHRDGYPDRVPGGGYVAQAAQLTEARREFAWLREGSTVVQQGALRDLDRAFANFFSGRARFPRFRTARDVRQGFVVRDLRLRRLNRRWGAVLVPKAGWLRFKISRQWSDLLACTSARVTVERGRWHVAFVCPPPVKRAPGTGAVVGIDRGVTITAATSDGELLHIPGLTAGERGRMIRLEQKLAAQPRAPRGSGQRSRRREATLAKITALRNRLAERRRDWIEKTSTDLASRYDRVAVEDLRTANMIRRAEPQPDPDSPGNFLPNGAAAKTGLNREISASCWNRLATRLHHKTEVTEVPAFHTSQCCNRCNRITDGNRESQAVFVCKRCGHEANADVNAARNIRDLAYRGVTLGRGTPAAARNTATPCDANLQTAS